MYIKSMNGRGPVMFLSSLMPLKILGWKLDDGRIIFANSHRRELRGESNGIAMTRSQGYRYWDRHFPNRPEWHLPSLVRAAVNIEAEDEEMQVAFQYPNGDIDICTRKYTP